MEKIKRVCLRYVLLVAVAFLCGISVPICDAKAAVKVSTSYEKAKSVKEGSTTIAYKHNVKTWNGRVNVVKFTAPSDGIYQVKISNVNYNKPASLQLSVEYYDGGYHSIMFDGGKTNDQGRTGILQAANKKYQKQSGGMKNWPKTSDWTNLEMKKGDVAWLNVISNGTDPGNIKFKITVKKTNSKERLVQFPHVSANDASGTDSSEDYQAKTAGTARYGRDCLRWAEETREFTKIQAAAGVLYQKFPMEYMIAGESYSGVKYDEPKFYDVEFKEGGISSITLTPYLGGSYEISIWGLNTYNGTPVEKNIRFSDGDSDLSFQGLEGIRDHTVKDHCAYTLCSDGYRVSNHSSDVIVLNMETAKPITVILDKNKIYTGNDTAMLGHEWHIKIGIKRIYKDEPGGKGILGGKIGINSNVDDVYAKAFENAPIYKTNNQITNVSYTDGETQTVAYRANQTAEYQLVISGLSSNKVRDF